MTEYNIKHYRDMQKLEIDEHKYFMSQQAGHDVGYQKAISDWISSGHAERFNQAYMEHLEIAEGVCKLFEQKELPIGLVHIVLED